MSVVVHCLLLTKIEDCPASTAPSNRRLPSLPPFLPTFCTSGLSSRKTTNFLLAKCPRPPVCTQRPGGGGQRSPPSLAARRDQRPDGSALHQRDMAARLIPRIEGRSPRGVSLPISAPWAVASLFGYGPSSRQTTRILL